MRRYQAQDLIELARVSAHLTGSADNNWPAFFMHRSALSIIYCLYSMTRLFLVLTSGSHSANSSISSGLYVWAGEYTHWRGFMSIFAHISGSIGPGSHGKVARDHVCVLKLHIGVIIKIMAKKLG